MACGVPAESWRTWERDNVQPRGYLEIVHKIAEASGADYDWLLDGRRSSPSPDGGVTAGLRPNGGTQSHPAASRAYVPLFYALPELVAA